MKVTDLPNLPITRTIVDDVDVEAHRKRNKFAVMYGRKLGLNSGGLLDGDFKTLEDRIASDTVWCSDVIVKKRTIKSTRST